MAVTFEVLGTESAGPTLALDHEQFAYAGNFRTGRTGKTVARDGDVVGAVAFNSDHADPATVHLRYVTVRRDRRGEGIGARLLRFTAEALVAPAPLQDGCERVVIAVNNPIAYRAAYRAGFGYTGTETGVAELELVYDPGRTDPNDNERFGAGLAVFEGRDLPTPQVECLELCRERGVPPVVEVPDSADVSGGTLPAESPTE